MDPRSGQVLAIASTPSFDNNVYGPPVDAAALRDVAAAPGSPMLEHVTQAVAPPGSTFKLVVAAANQAHPVFPPEQAVPTGADFTYGGHTFGNWKPMGPMNLVQSIAMSNDVYFYKLAVALGPDAMIDTARALGVGQRTGIDLPAESGGYLGTPDSVRANGGTWYGGSTVILGIGQGYLQVTPLQNARWTAAVATGRLVTPRLGLAVGKGGGTYARSPPSTAKAAAATATMVAASSSRKVDFRNLSGVRRAAAPAPQPQRAQHQRRRRDDDRHQRDVDEFEDRLQPLDVLAQRRLHAAQFAAGRRRLGAEAVDGAGLLRRQRRVGVGRLAGRKARAISPGSASIAFQRLLLGGVAIVGGALDCWTTSKGRTEVPRLRRPTSASPPPSTSIALVTKSPLLATGTTTWRPKKSRSGPRTGRRAGRYRRPPRD